MVAVIGESSGSDNPYVLRTVSADTVVNGGLVVWWAGGDWRTDYWRGLNWNSCMYVLDVDVGMCMYVLCAPGMDVVEWV